MPRSSPVDAYPARVSPSKTILFLLIGVFLVLAPLSVSGSANREGAAAAKWLRVGTLAAIALVGAQWFKWPKRRDLTGSLWVFASVFLIAALWSTSPLWGLLFKGMFVASIMAGSSLASALRDEADFRRFARTITAVTACFTVGVLRSAFATDGPVIVSGRLVVAELNPNALGQSCAVFALLGIFHLVVRDKPRWLMLVLLNIASMLSITILSGSRGSLLMLASGVCLLLPLLGRGRRQSIMLAAVSTIVLSAVGTLWFFVNDNNGHLNHHGPSVDLRMVDQFTRNTRLSLWSNAIRAGMESPIIGCGWLHEFNRWKTVQSAYLQVFVEAGALGTLPLLWFLVGAVNRIRASLLIAKIANGNFQSLLGYVFSATLFALLCHGAFESSAVTGASPIAILLGFCVGQLDQLMHWHRSRR